MAHAGPLQLGVIGGGHVFERFHLPALRRSRRFRIVSACDSSRPRREWLGQALGLDPFESTSRLLEETAPRAVLICTPSGSHARLAAQALAHGAHVLVEKPLALDPAEARSLVRQAEQRGLVLRIGFNRRFRRASLELKEEIQKAGEGRVADLRYELTLDSRWLLVRPTREQAAHGSLLDDAASHALDLLPWLTAREIESVRVDAAKHDEHGLERADFTVSLQEGMQAICSVGRGSQAREWLELRLADRRFALFASGLFASRALPPLAARELGRIHSAFHFATRRLLGRPNATAESFAAQLDAFADAVGGARGEPGASGVCGARAVCAVRALDRSLARGGTWESVETWDAA